MLEQALVSSRALAGYWKKAGCVIRLVVSGKVRVALGFFAPWSCLTMFAKQATGEKEYEKSWFKTKRHTCFVLASLCHGRTNCFNQFQKPCTALEPRGIIEAFKGKCPEHWEGEEREERSDILLSAPTLTGGIWSVQEVKIREGSGKALHMNKWFACRAWLWMTPDHRTAKMQPNPHRSSLDWGTWECSKSGWTGSRSIPVPLPVGDHGSQRELCTLWATSPVWMPQEQSRA